MKPIHIVILAKAPQPGRVKTRLIPALGAHRAARLAHHMLQHTLQQALQAQIGPVELCADPALTEHAWSAVVLPAAIAVSEQGQGDLGRRLAQAVRQHTQAGASVLLIGTDCPDLDAMTLQRSAQSLKEHDAVMIPAFDGGYVLLGLHEYHPSLFEDMAWSTPHVAHETQARLHALDLSLAILPKLHDIDESADLTHLPETWRDIFIPGEPSFCKKNG